MVWYTKESAAERADELLSCVKPFGNDSAYWSGAGQLILRLKAALPRVAACATACDDKFGPSGPDRFNELRAHVVFFADRDLLRPARHSEAMEFAGDLADRVRSTLEELKTLATANERDARTLRGDVLAEAERHHKRLEILTYAAERLGDEHPDDWAWNL